MKPRLGTIVAVRELREIGSRQKVVTVRLGKPRKVRGGDWACPYQISGLGRAKVHYAYGVDALQALILAIEGIRTALEKTGRRLSWVGGEPGDTGFPRFVPTFFGLDFSKRLNKFLDQEVRRFARRAERKSR